MKLNILFIISAFIIEASAMSSKLSAASKQFHRSNAASTSQYAGVLKFLGGIKNTMIKNTNARKQKIAMQQNQTISLRTKHVCNMCKILVKRNGEKRKRCAIYLKKNVHQCNPVKQSDFSSFV